MVRKPKAMKPIKGHITKIARIFPLLLAAALLFAPALFAAPVQVSLEAAPDRVQVGDVFRLIVHITGTVSIDDIQIQGAKDFQTGSPSRTVSTTLVNGTFSKSLEYAYGVQPNKEGTYTIGPAVVQDGGMTYTSNTVKVQVDPVEEIRGREQDSMFLTAEILPPQAYMGQEIICRIRFYWSISIGNIQFEGFPDMDSLEFTQIGDSRQFKKNINGKTFNVAELLHAVTPSAAGDYEIPPLAVKAEFIKRSQRQSRFPRGFFDDRFFGNEERIKTRVLSDPVSFSVKPLPLEGQPKDFMGLVGQFSAMANLDPKEVKAGDSATLTVTLSGRGNVQLLPDLELPPLPGVKVYPSEPQLQDARDGQGPVGKKIMQWALVPQVEGDIPIPPFSVPYFNPASNKYGEARTQAAKLHVLPGNVATAPSPAQDMQVSNASKHRVQMIGEDILKIHESPKAVSPGMGQAMPLWVGVLILGFPFIPVAGALLIRRMSKSRQEQAGARASKKAFGVFSRTIKDLGPDQATLAFRALQDYLALRLGLEAATLTSHEAGEKLLAVGVDGDLVSRLIQIFSGLETCVFSQCSQEFSQETKQELLNTVRVIDKKVKV